MKRAEYNLPLLDGKWYSITELQAIIAGKRIQGIFDSRRVKLARLIGQIFGKEKMLKFLTPSTHTIEREYSRLVMRGVVEARPREGKHFNPEVPSDRVEFRMNPDDLAIIRDFVRKLSVLDTAEDGGLPRAIWLSEKGPKKLF